MEQDMQYILQIYKDRSFSKAAQKLFLTQPALSIAVKRVEANLGAEIFDRSRHPLELTQAGEVYMQAVREIQNIEEELSKAVEDLRGLQTGTLRIGGTHYINSYLMASVLAAFSRQYPGISLQVMEASSPALVQALSKREIDLTINCDPAVIGRFENRYVFSDHLLLAVPKSFSLPPEVRAAALSAADILRGRHFSETCPIAPLEAFERVEFLLLTEGSNLHERCVSMFREVGIRPHVTMKLAQLVTAYRFADNGMGATFISDRMVRSPVSQLDFYKLSSPLSTRDFYMLLPLQNYIPFAVRRFMDFAEGHILEDDMKRAESWQ